MSENNGVTGERQVVLFDLNKEAYGVDISQVREITRVPRVPEFVEGVINLRGKVNPVVDLRARFSMPSTERTDEHGIVVVDVDCQDPIVMLVEAVTEVSRTPSDSIEPPSSVITTDDSEYLTGIVKTDDKLIILLDIAKVISESEASALEEIQQSPDAVAA